jgi:hypothetical protein
VKTIPFTSDWHFDTLLAKLDPLYARVDQLWVDSHMSELPCPGRRCLTDAQTVREEMRFAYINRVGIPFELKEVERALWRHLTDPRLRNPTGKHTQVRSAL